MACVSQSIARYKLLRCIVSAAQFAGGELCFYENHAELVAQDAAGETTSPLWIEYDVLLHFRVVRQQQLMRIELPRSIVWRWAEANGFLSELDGGESLTHAEMDKPCTLIEQLREADMTHFLRSVAPLVAASRRARSASRVSTTEPLPLTYYPPSPEAASVATTEKTSAADGGGDDVRLRESSNGDDDRGGGEDASSENVSAACRSQRAATVTVRSLSPGAATSVAAAGSNRQTKGGDTRENFAPSTLKTTPVASMNASNAQRVGEEEEERLSRCLEALDAEMDTSAVHLARGFTSQNSGLLAHLATQNRERGVAASGGSSEAAVASTPPPPSLSPTDLQGARQVPGKGKSRRCAAPCRRPPHVGAGMREEVGATPKRARKENSPTPSLLAGAATVDEAVAATGAAVRAASVELSAAGAPHDHLPATLNSVTPPSAAAAAPPAGHDTVSVSHSTAAAGMRNAAGANLTGGAAYNFADFTTAPENAAHLPLLPEVKKVLLDLEEMLPHKRRRRGAGDTKTPRPPPRRGAAGRRQCKATTKGLGKGKNIISTEETKTANVAQPPHPMASDCERASPLASEAAEAAAAAFGEIVASPPEAAPLNVKPSGASQHALCIQTPASPTIEKPQQTSVSERPKAGHTSDTSAAAAAANCCLPSACVTPMSDYHLAEAASHQYREPGGERNKDLGPGCASSMRATSAATAATNLLGRRASLLEQTIDGKLLPTPSGAHTPLPFAPDLPPPRHVQEQENKQYGTSFTAAEGNSRKNRWRRVVRQLNSLSLHLTQARACGEELRGLFLLMLEDAEV
ncbi:uncharacterized protein Tco025E_02060 [Trypanosoma conorhini]|uniref:Uncharacterized protein n=1 Tax=Trypanosoma conorhini TaxID=83891 RepID=A0A422Q750_9TRYP|nr:uncharacterized protein Tco025E_02060 [Trypanosoma conorhini]RNF25805.1 hypothetical protein Tco025E_02060 [Trypanosoma conorhini]